MKNNEKLKVAAPTGFSIFLLGAFFIVAVGSLPLLLGVEAYYEDSTLKSLGNNKYEKVTRHRENPYEKVIKRGERYNGWWDGPVVTEKEVYIGSRPVVIWKRETNYVDGARQGEEIFTKYNNEGNIISTEVICYQMGKRIDCKKSAGTTQSDASAYGIFEYDYPWLLPYYNGYGFSNEYIEMYMDTIEQILETHEIEPDEFDDTYSDVISDLEENDYDSIININEMYATYNGLDLMLKNEFRLAVISKLRKQEQSTYNEVENSYANYLSMLNELEVTNADFEQFCEVFDSVYTSYGATDVEDPFFSDTVDVRLFRALSEIASIEDSVKSSVLLKSGIELIKTTSLSQKAESLLQHFMDEPGKTPQEVSQTLILLIILEFSQGDYLKNSVHESFMNKMNVPILPTVTTSVSGNNTNALQVTGYVIDDGGGEITQRGIAWAEVYNPTIYNNIKESGSGTGSFNVDLTELDPGKTYYARTFANNSAGTAYGNCVDFMVSTASGITNQETPLQDLVVYPNPAADKVFVSFFIHEKTTVQLSVIDMNGRVVHHKELSQPGNGQNSLQVNVSSFKQGIYNCRLSADGEIISTKLVVNK